MDGMEKGAMVILAMIVVGCLVVLGILAAYPTARLDLCRSRLDLCLSAEVERLDPHNVRPSSHRLECPCSPELGEDD